MNPFILHLVLLLVLRELAKFKGQIDWMALRGTVDQEVRDFVPGAWFDDEAVAAANFVIDGCHRVLDDDDKIKALLTDVGSKKWQDAVSVLHDLLSDFARDSMVQAAVDADTEEAVG